MAIKDGCFNVNFKQTLHNDISILETNAFMNPSEKFGDDAVIHFRIATFLSA